MIAKLIPVLIAALLSANVEAQKVVIKLGIIEGAPCVMRSVDRANSTAAPVQRATFGQRLTQIDAVIVGGSGAERENAALSACGEKVRAETSGAKTANNLNLYYDLYRQQVQQCIDQRDRRIPVYDIYFLSDERCLTSNLSIPTGFTPGRGNYRFDLSPAEINASLPKQFSTVEWSKLPIAGEYKSTEVRYLYLDGNDFADLPYKKEYNSCGSRQTVFFFTTVGLFRIALRHLQCSGVENVNRTIAESVGARIVKTNYGSKWSIGADEKIFAGLSGVDWGTLEWRKTESPKYDNQDW